MDDKYLAYPTSVKELAYEIKKACNDYKTRRIGNAQLQEIILWYAQNCPDKLFNGDNYNPTLTTIIGKKRIAILNALLDGYQQRIL